MFTNFEINGNLDDFEVGVPNYINFATTVVLVRARFIHYFGDEIMSKHPLMIDNAAMGHSGHTPIITPVWNHGLIMKLHIDNGKETSNIIYQSAHEFTHYIFYSLMGINKASADVEEEAYCSAVSLIMIKELSIENFENYLKHVSNLSNEGYRKGLDVAIEVGFDMNKLKEKILKKANEIKN